MPKIIEDFEERAEKLSEIYSNDLEDFDGFSDETGVIDGDFTEEKTAPKQLKDKTAIEAEPIFDDKFASFLSELPQNTEITIIVNRKPDHNLRFRLPNKSYGHTETLYWNGESAPEIYDIIKKRHGGGRYQFQIRGKAGFSKNSTWESTIFDPHEPSEAEQILLNKEQTKTDEQNRKAESSHVFAETKNDDEDSIDKFFDNLEKWERRINKIRPQPETAPVSNPSMSFDEQLMLRMFDASKGDTQFTGKLVDYAFGVFDDKKKEEKTTFASVITTAIENPEKVKGILEVVGGVVASLFLKPPATAPVNQFKPGQSQAAPVNLESFRKPSADNGIIADVVEQTDFAVERQPETALQMEIDIIPMVNLDD